MTSPLFIYAPVWPEIAPWAVRLTTSYDVPLQPPLAPKDIWATEEVRKLEIQRLLSAHFTLVPSYEVHSGKRYTSILERAINRERRFLDRVNTLEDYQELLRKLGKRWICRAMNDNQQNGRVPLKVRPLTELCYMEVFRSLPENRRVIASAHSIDPVRLLVLVATKEDETSKKDEEQEKSCGDLCAGFVLTATSDNETLRKNKE